MATDQNRLYRLLRDAAAATANASVSAGLGQAGPAWRALADECGDLVAASETQPSVPVPPADERPPARK